MTRYTSRRNMINEALPNGRRLANTTPRGGEAMSVYEALALMIAFAVLIIKLIDHIKK